MNIFRRSDGPDRTKVPVPLIAGEVFLCMVIIRYMLNFIISLYVDTEDAGSLSLRIFTMIFSLAMILVVINSVIGIASARPKAWRKVVRTSLILLAINATYRVLESFGIYSDSVMFDDTFLFVMTALTMAVMFLPSVRSFYLPPLTENPPLGSWIGYVFVKRLFPDATYSFVIGEDADDQTVPERPSGFHPLKGRRVRRSS